MMKRDEKWDCFEGIETDFNTYAGKVGADMFLKAEISDDIHQSFRIIKRLLQCSFYEYEFYDIAAFQSLIALEMAFRIRYMEIKGEDCPQKKTLQDLFKMFFKLGYLEIYDSFFLDHIRSVRNSMTHRAKHGFGGPGTIQWVHHSIDLINDLYEDINLRKERIDKTRDIDHIFKSLTKQGCIIRLPMEISYFLYDLSVLFYNNKSLKKNISFCYMPIYDLPEDNMKGYPPFFLAEIEEYEFSKGIFYGVRDEKVNVIIEPITNDTNRKYFDAWAEKYHEFNNKHICDNLISFKIGKLYNAKRREFHKQ